MEALSDERIQEVLASGQRGRPVADPSHPLGFLRTVRDKLGPPPYDPDALLEIAKGEPGFYQVSRHEVLDPHRLQEVYLRSYAARACAEVHEITYQQTVTVKDEQGNERQESHWFYDDPESCDLDRYADHLRWRMATDETRDENMTRLKEILMQRAAQAGTSIEQLLAEADSRFNEKHDDIGVDVELAVNGA